MNIQTKIVVLLSLIPLAGCSSPISEAINRYYNVKNQVQIGDHKDQVLAILQPTQIPLSNTQRKQPETYRKDEKLVEIYYFRSLHQNDTILTDDEFTPYVFEDGILAAIGWQALGGPKTQAQPQPESPRVILHGGYGYYRW